MIEFIGIEERRFQTHTDLITGQRASDRSLKADQSIAKVREQVEQMDTEGNMSPSNSGD